MNKYILEIDGMRCPMCESHLEETIKKSLTAAYVKANHRKNTVTVIIDKDLQIEDFKAIIEPTGYRVLSLKSDTPKKTFFGWR